MSNFVFSNSLVYPTKSDLGSPTSDVRYADATDLNALAQALYDIRSEILSYWNILNYGADNTGGVDVFTALSSACSAITASANGSGILILPQGQYRLATNFTVPSGVVLFPQNALINIATTKVLTFNGALFSPSIKVFSSPDNSPVLFSGPQDFVNVMWFGADPTGVASSTLAFVQASNSLNGPAASSTLINGTPILRVPPGNYVYSGTIPSNVHRSIYGVQGSGPPSAGLWAVGDQYIFTDAAPGDPQGYQCVTAGSPGTWKPFGLVSL